MSTPHQRLTRTTFSLPLGEVHALVGGAVNARPLTTFFDRMREAETHIAIPLLQLHGSDDGCIVPPTDEDRRLFDARVLEVMPNLGHFLHVEAPATIAARVARWLA
jgi:pimeloyl-ACP methyl ester carboxylesterase